MLDARDCGSDRIGDRRQDLLGADHWRHSLRRLAVEGLANEVEGLGAVQAEGPHALNVIGG